ncbi:BrnA antitoxin family protein [Rhizobium sp. RAF56]|uniref:BrnA antitoxin family protein n=1 Tax=Rhizobium sp. RAF56 TaxID=3233062 RepID=UPI003F9D533D
MSAKAKPMPSLRSDEAAERFVEEADLTAYDLSGFKPMRFEVEPKLASLNMRLPQPLLDALKRKAKARGIPYARYVRMLLENDLAK